MDVAFLVEHGPEAEDRDFLCDAEGGRSYRWLREAIAGWGATLDELAVGPGAIVAVESDYGPSTAALLLALLERDCIAVPVWRALPAAAKATIAAVAGPERWLRLDAREDWELVEVAAPPRDEHPLLATLRARGHPGLILFTSGSSGTPKAVVHDAPGLLARFRAPRARLDMLAVLVFDHLGGLNTLFHTLGSGGTLFAVADRQPDTICAAIARHRIAVLPASPTFLQMMLLSEGHERHDLSSLRLITYGAEPMAQATLDRLHAALPAVKIKQTYGLIEVGAFPSHSRAPDSLWVTLDVEHRVVDGILELRTPAVMLGYLNAPSPFTADGWFQTGDRVEQDGAYLRILGRASELINVGGEKVFPQEVEAVIAELDGIRDVEVYGEANALVGAVVCARIRVDDRADRRDAVRRLKRHCRDRLERHKVPVKVEVTDEELATTRGKRLRQGRGGA